MTFQSDLMTDAREYLSSHFGIDLHDVPSDSVRTFIDSLYAGGWTHYEANFRRYQRNMAAAAGTEEYSPIKQRAIVGDFTKRLKEYDEIISFDFIQGVEATFVVSRASVVKETTRRDIVTEREITLYKFAMTESGWRKEEVSITESVKETHHRYGGITTVERAASAKEQFETCYRPGTASSPLQGWVSRLQLSWEQAHEGETFPTLTKEK